MDREPQPLNQHDTDGWEPPSKETLTTIVPGEKWTRLPEKVCSSPKQNQDKAVCVCVEKMHLDPQNGGCPSGFPLNQPKQGYPKQAQTHVAHGATGLQHTRMLRITGALFVLQANKSWSLKCARDTANEPKNACKKKLSRGQRHAPSIVSCKNSTAIPFQMPPVQLQLDIVEPSSFERP